jgi:L-aspartate oxidase
MVDRFDVVVVGAGAAGLYTALCLPLGLKVAVITKGELSLSASDWAQGGIAAVVDPQDSTELHLADTLRAGVDLCDRAAVQALVEQAADCIQTLCDMGVAFDRSGGQLALTLEAAHSRRRVLHAADTTGRAVVSILLEQVMGRSNIQLLAPALVLDLHQVEGRCAGLRIAYEGQIQTLEAQAVILATGGGGQVFAQTTNPAISTGDGVAIAYRSGAVLRDLEFVQFHPTALTVPGAPRFLISEAVRGEGAHLVDRTGYRFAFDYHPDGELAPRDVVSRAIFNHLQATESDPASAHVLLDLRSIPPDKIRHRFPNIIQVCQRWGVDPFTQPIPVTPAAHYWMGGVQTDLENRTTIAGLYAVGETASTGVHGANRLASNSLLECIVFGAKFRDLAVDPPMGARPAIAHYGEFLCPPGEAQAIEQMRQELPKIVWQGAGICREANVMAEAIDRVQTMGARFDRLMISEKLIQPGHWTFQPQDWATIRAWSELHNLLDVAELLLKSAAFRTESRGGHYRSDYPETVPAWTVHTLVQRSETGGAWRTQEVSG